MIFSNVVALCIVIATAVTLNLHGITKIQTSSQAAKALRPVAGEFAFAVFSLGIVLTGLLAVPVLAGSAAYAVSELFGWKAGAVARFHEARGFYLIIVAATAIGTLMSVVEVDPIRALVWSAIVKRGDLSADHGSDDVDRTVAPHRGRPHDELAPPALRLRRYRGDGGAVHAGRERLSALHPMRDCRDSLVTLSPPSVDKPVGLPCGPTLSR